MIDKILDILKNWHPQVDSVADISRVSVVQHVNQLISMCSDDYAHVQSFVASEGIEWLKNQFERMETTSHDSNATKYYESCIQLLVVLCSYEKFVLAHINMIPGCEESAHLDFVDDICSKLLCLGKSDNSIYYGILASIHIIKFIYIEEDSTNDFKAIGLSSEIASCLLKRYVGLLQHLTVSNANIHLIELVLNTIVSMISSSTLDYINSKPCQYLLSNVSVESRYETMENRKVRFAIEAHMKKRAVGYASILIRNTPFMSIIVNIIDDLYSDKSSNIKSDEVYVDNANDRDYIIVSSDSANMKSSAMDGYQQSFIVCLGKVFLAMDNEDAIKNMLEKKYMELPHVERGMMPTSSQYGAFRRKAVVQMCLLTSMQATLGSWAFLHHCGSDEVKQVEELDESGFSASRSSNPLTHLICLLASPDYYNQNLASEVICLAASEPSCHATLGPLIESSTLTQLLRYSPYVSTRTAIASALTKLGLKASALKNDSDEITSYLNIISDTLKVYNASYNSRDPVQPKGSASATGLVSFSVFDNIAHTAEQAHSSMTTDSKPNIVKLSSLERVVEMLAALVGKTYVKEEIVFGSYRVHSMVSELVCLLNIIGSGMSGGSKSVSGGSQHPSLHSPTVLYGLLHTFSLLTVCNKELHAKALAEKDMTYEQYTEMKKLHKLKAKQEANAAAGRDKDAPEGELEAEADEEEDDTEEMCKKRIQKIVSCETIKALVGLLETNGKSTGSNSLSKRAVELICKIFRQISVSEIVRGHIIQQGGLKAMLDVAGDDKIESGIRREAGHCIAKTLVTTNPILLKEHQRLSAIRSLLYLCKEHNSTDLQQFEGLLSLTNLLSMGQPEKDCFGSKSVGGLNIAHHMMFSDHLMVRRAATECLCNMAGEEGFHKLLRDPSKIKFWVSLIEEYDLQCVEVTADTIDGFVDGSEMDESFKTARAICGTLAMSCHDCLVSEACLKEGLCEVLMSVLSRQFDVALLNEKGVLSITIQKHFEILHRVFELIYQMCSCEFYCREDGTPFESQREADSLNSNRADSEIMRKRKIIATQLMTGGLLPTIQLCFGLYTLSHKNKKPVNLLPPEIIETATNICGILQYFSN